MPTRSLIPATRLWGLVAHNAPRALILRRGPSKQVLAVMWHTDTNAFYAGQWFKGRIYEQLCDLSPSGKRWVYRAETHRGLYQQWTALSRPPYLTALTLWAGGGAWGGGGIFDSETRLRINHGIDRLKPALGFVLPRGVQADRYDDWADPKRQWPLHRALAQRHGWQIRQESRWGYSPGGTRGLGIVQPEIRWKRRGNWIIEARVTAYGEPGGPGLIREFRVLDDEGELKLDFGRCDWADWSFDGRLLLGREGRLWSAATSKTRGPGKLEEMIDLRKLRFEPMVPPEEAKRWTGEVLGRPIA